MTINFTHAYPDTFRLWIKRIFSDPGSWILPSLLILLFSLPVITYGAALGFGYTLAFDKVRYDKIPIKERLKTYLRSNIALRCFFMGLLDILILVFLCLSIMSIVYEYSSIPLKLISAFFIWLDVIFLISSIYRYPILCLSDKESFFDVIYAALVLTFGHLGHSLFILLFKISLLIISVFTGIGVFVFFFGASCLFDVYHYEVIAGEV